MWQLKEYLGCNKRQKDQHVKFYQHVNSICEILDWTGVVDSEPTEEEEMFSLATWFAARMLKWSTTLEGEATSSSREKQPRRSPSDGEAQKDWAIVSVESLDLASNDQPALGVCLNKANTPLEEGVPVASPPNVEEVGMGAPLGGSYCSSTPVQVYRRRT